MTRTMLLVHGAFCGGWCWESFTGYFESQGWRCIAPTLRHHQPGASLKALARTGITEFVHDLAEIAENLDEPPVLVGHSMGGLLCQKLAARGLGAALLLLAPSAPWGILPSSRSEVEARLGLMHLGPFWSQSLLPDFDIAVGTSLDKLSPRQQVEVFERLVPESGRALFEILFWQLDPAQASAVNARKVTCPVLCAVGNHDRVVSPTTVRSVARLYRERATFHSFPDHSHFLFGEPGSEQIAAFCDGWLRQVLD